jgi:hypothetical protein
MRRIVRGGRAMSFEWIVIVIGAVCFIAGWWAHGFLRKERGQIAQRDAATPRTKTTSWYPPGVEPQRGQYRYTVKESADRSPWIAGEPAGAPLKIVGTKGDDLGIGFNLRPGTTIKDAQKVAKFMNEWIVDIVLH